MQNFMQQCYCIDEYILQTPILWCALYQHGCVWLIDCFIRYYLPHSKLEIHFWIHVVQPCFIADFIRSFSAAFITWYWSCDTQLVHWENWETWLKHFEIKYCEINKAVLWNMLKNRISRFLRGDYSLLYTCSSQFQRSRVNGSRGSCVQAIPESDSDKTLIFESRFESGNLGRVVQV